MNKPMKILVASLLVCVVAISIGSVAATNGYQNGDLDQTQLREQLQDGSCCDSESTIEPQQNMTRTQAREQLREQLKDGYCTETEPLQERNQEQLREQLRNGNCTGTENTEDPLKEMTQERSQLQGQFRNGWTD